MKQITLYHGTTSKSAERIFRKGFDSHTWFATNSKRAKFFGSLKTDKPIILKVVITDDELKQRALVKQSTSSKKEPFTVIGYEYLLHSYRLQHLRPITSLTEGENN